LANRTAAISYHSAHRAYAHQLFARLILTLGREQVFFADYRRGRTQTGVSQSLTSEFENADIVVILLSDQHFTARTMCYLEWEEAVRRKQAGDPNRWDVTAVECSQIPNGWEPDNIVARPVRQITSDVLSKLSIGPPGRTTTIRDQILANYGLSGTVADTCCLVAAGTLLRANYKACRKIEVAKQLQNLSDMAYEASAVPTSPKFDPIRYKVWQALMALLNIFVDADDREAHLTDNPYFFESLPIVRLETYLSLHLPSQGREIFKFCDDLNAIAGRNRDDVGTQTQKNTGRSNGIGDARISDRLVGRAGVFASELVNIDRLPAIELGPSPRDFHEIMSRYGDDLAQAQKLIRTRLS
jgi:hypothetical protein